MKVGSGSLQFELVEGWEQLPEGYEHEDVAGVCSDSQGNVYLFCRGEHPVMVYDRSGKFLASWGEGEFSYRIHGMHMTANDELYLVDDSGNSVARYTTDGKKVFDFEGSRGVPSDSGYDGSNHGSVKYGGPAWNRPTNVSLAPNGELYVSDGYGNSRVHRYDANGKLLQSWGEPGEGAGLFRLPHSVWAHTDGRVFVADRENDRIQIFDANGNYLTEWLDVQRPQDIFIDKDGLVYVGELMWHKGMQSFRRGIRPDEEPSRMSVYDLDGNLLLRWGDADGSQPGHFVAPHGIWVDNEGSLYMAEVTQTIGVRPGFYPRGTHTFQKFARV